MSTHPAVPLADLALRRIEVGDLAPGLLVSRIDFASMFDVGKVAETLEHVHLGTQVVVPSGHVQMWRQKTEGSCEHFTTRASDLFDPGAECVYAVPADLPHVGDLCLIYRLDGHEAEDFAEMVALSQVDSSHEFHLLQHLRESSKKANYFFECWRRQPPLYGVLGLDRTLTFFGGLSGQRLRTMQHWAARRVGRVVIQSLEQGEETDLIIESAETPLIERLEEPWRGSLSRLRTFAYLV